MSEENKENGFNHVKTFTKIIFIFSVLGKVRTSP